MLSAEIWKIKNKLTAQEMLAHPAYTRTRISSFMNKEYFTIYFHCSNSPSGSMRAGGGKISALPSGIHATCGPNRGDIAAKKWGI